MRKRFVTNKRDKITTIKRILLWIIICGIAIGSWEENVYAQGFVPRYSAPDTSNSYYYSNNNPLYAAGYGMPNCTAYAYGRAYEILGTKPNLSTGNAGRWWTYNISSGAYGYSETVPQIGSVVCWDNNDSNTGHVAVVEKIENGIVTISMSNYGGEIFQVCTFSTSNPTMLTDVSTGSTFRATTGNTRFLGYIYILPNSLFGSLDYIAADAGIVHVSGWVMDMANMSKSIEAHVYVGGPAESYGASGVERFVVTANSERTDIETAYPGAGNYHGYQASLATSLSGEQPVYVYALNTDTGLSAHIATSSVTIPAQAVPTSVSLNKATATLTAVGETTQLTATIAPTNAVDKSVSWKSSNTSVATVSSTGLVTAVGNGTATITVTTTSGSKTATCKVTVEIPTVDANGWCYVSTLPSGVTSSSYEIQYQNIYEKYATSSPETDWKDTGTDKTEYVASGDTYISYGLPLTTSNTVKLVDTFYYHFCSGSTSNWVNYAQTTTYTHYDELKSDSVYEYSSSPDGEDNRYTSYYLKWSNGSDAYCSTANGTCDGSNGTHGERSQYWYKAYVYQNYVAQTLNLYRKTGDWTTTKDSSATSVNYRYRLKITGVTLSKTGATLTSKGETLQLTTTVTPIDATNKSVTWTSSNTSVATVSSSGLVTAVGNGTATITATAVAGGKTATCKVTVSIAPIGVTLDKTTATLTSKGATTQLTATVAPTNAADKTVTWKSSDTSVATVSSSGLVTAVGNGTATITVTTNTSSKTATCKVTVNIAVTGVTLDKTTATLTKARETLQLTATVSPATAANKNVTWTSSDTSVATVSQDGLVTAVGIGTCTITATAADGSGKYATCEITIKGNTYEVPIQYTISSLGNGHTSGTMESLTNCISDETYELPANTFAKTGHTFIGWNTSADGSGTTYSDKESVENLSSEDGATVTLYAQWKPNTYTITFDPVGGRTDTTQKTVIYAETYGDLPIPTIVGGTFLGWYTDAQGGTQVTATDVVNITEDQTLYAHWELVYETAAPTASIPNGSEVEVGTKVSLTSETNGAQIYYTTDVTIGGNVSSETGTLYEEAITITEDVTIYAIAVKSGYKNSEVMTISYTVKDEVQDWGDITEEDRAELGFITTADIPNELWVAGAFDCDYTGKAIIYPGLHVYNYKTLLQPKVDYTIKYTNNTKAGTATITITGKGNYAGTIVKTFAIRPLDLSKATILNVTVPYTGKVQKATTTVTYLLDGKIVTLKSGTDFTYTYPGTDSKAQDYDSNAFKAAGNYTVVLNGKGNYTGTATFTQTITEKQIIGKMRLSKITNQKYTGSAITPTILLKNGKTSLIEGTDYTVAYSNNVEVGTATITITGIGDYIGTKMATFKITGTALSKAKLNSFATSLPWTGSPVTQNAMLTYTEGSGSDMTIAYLTENVDYTVEYQNNTDVGTATVIFTGKGGYTGTIKKTFKITGLPIGKATINGMKTSLEYDGKDVLQSGYTLTYATGNGRIVTLTEGTDYTVSYKNNQKAGTATITFTGINGYTGKLSKTYKITAYDFADESGKVTVSVIADQPYTKGGVTPKPVVTYKDANGTAITLVEGKDYTLKYTNHKAIADKYATKAPTVTITGKNGFKGSLTAQFTITGSDLSLTTMSAGDVVYQQKAGICKPAIVLYDTNGKKLAAGTDYNKTITYTYAKDVEVTQLVNKLTVYVTRLQGETVDSKDIIPVGAEITATVTGIKNYSGTQSATFRYVAGDMSKATIKVATQAYTGKAVEPTKDDITIKIGKTVLAKTDYEIVGYSNNVAKGTAKITIRGIGNYGGEKTVTFKITTKTMNYTITYDKNAEDATGTMKASTTAAGKNLTANAYKRTGYKFVGWNTRPDGSGVSYTNKEAFYLKNSMVVYGTKVTLYAQWEAK